MGGLPILEYTQTGMEGVALGSQRGDRVLVERLLGLVVDVALLRCREQLLRRVGYLVSTNPITALVAHVALHVTSALHGVDTTVTLPPHY